MNEYDLQFPIVLREQELKSLHSSALLDLHADRLDKGLRALAKELSSILGSSVELGFTPNEQDAADNFRKDCIRLYIKTS